MQKVKFMLTKQEIAQTVFEQVGEIVRTADFNSAGLSNDDVTRLCKKNHIERVRQGFYRLPGYERISDERLIATLLPQGIICLESALFQYGYSDFAPREWSVAVPRSISRTVKRMDQVFIKAYYIQNDLISLGKTSGDFNGVELPVYDRERTICDCFKYRSRLDRELFSIALNSYVADEKRNLANLSRYAKKMRLSAKMMSVVKMLINS